MKERARNLKGSAGIRPQSGQAIMEGTAILSVMTAELTINLFCKHSENINLERTSADGTKTEIVEKLPWDPSKY